MCEYRGANRHMWVGETHGTFLGLTGNPTHRKSSAGAADPGPRELFRTRARQEKATR